MSNPNSALTRLRSWIVRKVEPHPDAGEGWCQNCSLNNGRTRVLTADGVATHAQEHVASHPKDAPEIITIQSVRRVT